MSDERDSKDPPASPISVIVLENVPSESSEDERVYEIIRKRYMNDIPVVVRTPINKAPSEKNDTDSRESVETIEAGDKKSTHQDAGVQTQTICILSKIVSEYQRRLDLMVCLNIISTGMAIALPALFFENENSYDEFSNITDNIKFSDQEISWISSVNILTPILGVIFTGFFLKSLGSKRTFILIGLINVFSWLMMFLSFSYCSHSIFVAQILLARSFQGISAGVIRLVAMTFESEIAFTNLRGVLTILPSTALCSGMVIVNVFALIFPENGDLLCISCCILCILTTIGIIFVKDNPAFSMDQEHEEQGTEESKGSIPNLRVVSKEADGHTLILVRNLQEVISFGKRKRIIHDDYRDFLLNWRKKHLFKPIAILFGIFFFYAFSGQLPFCVYTALILKSLNMKEHVPLLVLGLNLTRLSVVCLAMLFSLKIGRTYIYMASGLLMTGCFIGMTLTKIFLDEPSVIIPSLLVVFIFFNFLGFISLVHVLTPEVMPKNFRSTVSSSIIIFDALIRFSITKAFPELVEAIGIEYVLVMFAGFTFLSTLFVLIFVPETHKKTQEDIPQLFSSQ